VLPSSFDPDIILSTLLSVYPHYRVLHPCFTFRFWPQKSLSAPYYQSPHNIQSFTPVLLSPIDPDITLSTLLSVLPQYTVLHPSVNFQFWPMISLSAPDYESLHNIQFFTPVLPSPFGPRYHSQHPITTLPTI